MMTVKITDTTVYQLKWLSCCAVFKYPMMKARGCNLQPTGSFPLMDVACQGSLESCMNIDLLSRQWTNWYSCPRMRQPTCALSRQAFNFLLPKKNRIHNRVSRRCSSGCYSSLSLMTRLIDSLSDSWDLVKSNIAFIWGLWGSRGWLTISCGNHKKNN